MPGVARGQAAPPPAATETIATAIPGVVAAGTKIEVIKSGFTGTEGPLGLPDGSLIFTETQANRITRIDKDTGATSTFLENTNGSNGLGWDAKGRLISVQTTPGAARIGVIYPKGAEATITDNYDGKPYGRPERSGGEQERRHLLLRARPQRHSWSASADTGAATGGVLRPAGREGDAGRRRPSNGPTASC